MQVNAPRLLRSACVSVFALVLAIGVVVFTAKAATYTAFISGVSVNWTATTSGGVSAVWNCATTATNDVCNIYPGQAASTAGFTDLASVPSTGSFGTLTVSSNIPVGVSLSLNDNHTLDIASGGTLNLVGTSAVTATSLNTTLSITNGTLNNAGTLSVASFGPGASVLSLIGGTIGGAGTTTIGTGSTFNMTGTAGPMTIDAQLIDVSGTGNFSANNTMTMSNGASIVNSGTFNANGNGTIAQGAGTASFLNNGTLTKGGGTVFTLGVPFANSATASVFSTGVGMSFTGGSAPDHNNATWTLGGPAGVMNFGGAHVMNGTEAFSGAGTVTINAGGTWTMNSASPTLATGVNLANNGTINFTSPTLAVGVAGGTFTQNAGGVYSPQIGPTNGTSNSINVIGGANVAGTLSPVFASGYTPVVGHSFTIMNCSGGCVTTALSYTPVTFPGGYFQLNNLGTSLQLLAVASPDLALSVTGPATANAASTVTYTATLSNLGGAASSATVSFTLTGGGTITSGTAAGFTCTPAGTTMTCTSTGPFGAGASTNFSVVTTAPNQAGTMTLGGTATSTPADSNNANNSGSFSTTINALTDIKVTKTGPATVTAGQQVAYTVSIQNLGPSDAQTVVVSDTPGAGLTFVSNTAPCAGGYPCNIATITAGSTVSFTSTYTVASSASGSVTNTASATTATPESSTANNSSIVTSTIGTSADLAITKTGPASASPGGTITYAISVVNNGPSDATAVQINDPAAVGLTFVSATGACSSFPCTIATIAAGSAVNISATYSISIGATGSVSDTATVTATTPDAVPGNNSSTWITSLVPTADLSITKTAPATVTAGGNVTFNITVTNNGPAGATSIVVDDVPGSGLTFVSASGACSSFPCTLASLSPGASTAIAATYHIAPSATSITNTAKITSSSPADSNTANNSSTVTRAVRQACPTGVPVLINPTDGQTNVPTSGTMQWTNVAAQSYDVFLGPAGTGCTTQVGTVNGATSFVYSGLQPNTDYEASVVARSTGCPSFASPCIRFHTAAPPCNLAAPNLVFPQNGATVSSPVTLQWGAVSGADSYHVVVSVNGVPTIDATTNSTSLNVSAGNGTVDWSVTALSSSCASAASTGRFSVCAPPPAPLAGVVGAPSSGHAYSVLVVNPQSDTTKYDYQEATNADFSDAVTQTSSATSMTYNHTVGSNAQVFFYRVRAYNACQTGPGGFSKIIRVVVLPEVVTTRPVLNVPVGTKDLVIEKVFIPGQNNQNFSFTATANKPWVVKIVPSFGTLTPAGETLSVYIDPTQLPNGTFDASIMLTLTPLTLADGRKTANGNTTYVTPVSVNIVTPVVPVDPSAPTSNSLIIPAVGHLIGVNSQWRSDIRVFNATTQKVSYLLNFISNASADVKQTTIDTAPGDTTALDDIIHNWYGFGEVGDNASGVLEVRPLLADTGTPSALSTIVSSRTYNLSSLGTLGQFIPGVPFTSFVGGGTRLSLQQIAQNQNFRTNFGLVEASGTPASVVMTMFDSAGTKLFDLPVSLNGGEQKQLNALLSQQGVSSLSDGRMEVQVTGGTGKVTAYASVVDNASGDPLFVPGRVLDNSTSQLYVMPGVADLNTNSASWRTDMRIFNSGTTAQTATLTFYPEGEGHTPLTASVSVNPNEVKVLDNILQSTFSVQNVGGAVHVDTPGGSQLVVTGRTYNLTSDGTLGQFIPAATPGDAIANGGRALNILQVEDSVRYRTNVGLAEMNGKAATVEISVIQPDTKITPSIQVPLQANEFVQFPLSSFGLGDVYNVRVSVKVIDGDGHVTAYGSVIDQATTAPTYVAAQ